MPVTEYCIYLRKSRADLEAEARCGLHPGARRDGAAAV